MKKQFFYFVLFLICRTINAQVYWAGTVYPYYYDITPDTLLNYDIAGSHVDEESYYIDIDKDSQFDIRLRCHAIGGPGTGWGYISAISLNTNTFKRYGRYDAPLNEKVALPLNLNDSINSKISIWDTTELVLTYIDRNMSGTFYIPDWWTNNDLYIGIKYENSTDTIYGWIRVNAYQPAWYSVKCLVKDYSFKSTCHSPTLLTTTSSSSVICSAESVTLSANGASTYTWSTGSNNSYIIVSPTVTTNYSVNATSNVGCDLSSIITQSVNACIGIQEYSMSNGLKIYPNPSNNYINISFERPYQKNLKLEIMNSLGQTVLKSEFKNQIDVSGLTNGFYTLLLKDNSGSVISKKFVKE